MYESIRAAGRWFGVALLIYAVFPYVSAGAPMPSVSVVRDRLITGIARGHGDLDWTALGLIAAEKAGLNVTPPIIRN
jgi:hypothetical protein